MACQSATAAAGESSESPPNLIVPHSIAVPLDHTSPKPWPRRSNKSLRPNLLLWQQQVWRDVESL